MVLNASGGSHHLTPLLAAFAAALALPAFELGFVDEPFLGAGGQKVSLFLARAAIALWRLDESPMWQKSNMKQTDR